MEEKQIKHLVDDLTSINESIPVNGYMTRMQLDALTAQLNDAYKIDLKLTSPTDVKWYLEHYSKKLHKAETVAKISGNNIAKEEQASTIST